MSTERVRITYLEILSDFTNETLERKFANEQIRRLLVSTNFTERDGTRPKPVRLLDTTSRGLSSLPSLLGRKLFARGFATSSLASSLLEIMLAKERVLKKESTLVRAIDMKLC